MLSHLNEYKWDKGKILVNDIKGSSGISMAYNNDEVYIIYEMDTDGDLETIEDKEIYYTTSNAGNTKKLTNNEVIDSNPQFVKNNQELGVIWYSNGVVNYML